MRLLCALGLFLALLHVTSCLLIGAFNIENFGREKFNKPKAIDIITKIVLRYDIILIQEVRCNNDLSVPESLLALVNKGSDQFRKIVSEPLPLGTSSHRERYLFLYKNKKVSVKDSFQYADEAGVFDRPPFVVKFSSTETGKEFVLIPIHTQPLTAAQAATKTKESKDGHVYKSTLQQLDALVDVVDAAEERWTNTNIMVLGDFNAGSNYVKDKDWKDIRLFTDRNFQSLINDVATTMAEHSIQTHDRIVVSNEMNKGVKPGSAKVFDFIKEYHPKKAWEVSDHFPVEVELAEKASKRPRVASGNGDSADPPPTKKRKPSG